MNHFWFVGCVVSFVLRGGTVARRDAECPVKSANPWTRWGSWCNSYEPDATVIGAVTLEQALHDWVAEGRELRERPQAGGDRGDV